MSTPWIALVIAFLASLACTRLAMSLFRRLALIDRPGSEAHKRHTSVVPYGGGAAMALAFAASLVAVLLMSPWHSDSHGTMISSARLIIVIIAAACLFVLGQIDDQRPLGARLKLVIQLAIIIAAVYFAELRIDLLQDQPLIAMVLAALWCVGITNAYNLLDHADGLSSTTAVISCVVLLSASLMNGDPLLSSLWLCLIGVLGGFLVWNLPPARIYMGDAGSLPLGFLMGAGCLLVTFWPSDEASANPYAVLAPVLVSFIPLYDMGVVVTKRIRRRVPIMRGDDNHISHRLRRLGLSARSSLAAVAALQVAIAASALQLRFADETTGLILLLQAGSILLALTLLEAARDRNQGSQPND